MDFEDFRKDIELKLERIEPFELLEFHYLPHCFGSGILAFKIKGFNHKFVYDGRDNSLLWQKSKQHQKYSESDWTKLRTNDGLKIGQLILQEEMLGKNKS